MKKVMFIVSVLVLSLQAAESMAALKKSEESVVCEKLLFQAEKNCEKAMCEELYDPGEECIKDGDYYEGLQICAYDNELPDLIKDYNKKHSKEKITCR